MNELDISIINPYTGLETNNNRLLNNLYNENIPDYCIRKSKDFKFNKNVILIVNCDSDLFLHPCIKSLYKIANEDDFSLVVFDNSNSTKFNIDIYMNYGFKNIIFYNNSYMWFYTDEPGRCILNLPQQYISKSASIMHAITVDYMMNLLKKNNVENLILADSDVLFKQNPLNIINTNYACIGELEDYKHRINPAFMYFNLKKLNINFFDKNRILGITSHDFKKYDTCGSFTEDLIINKLPYSLVNISDYVEHFGGGSYLYVADDIKGMHNVDCNKQDQPKVAYKVVCEWLKKNSDLYL